MSDEFTKNSFFFLTVLLPKLSASTYFLMLMVLLLVNFFVFVVDTADGAGVETVNIIIHTLCCHILIISSILSRLSFS